MAAMAGRGILPPAPVLAACACIGRSLLYRPPALVLQNKKTAKRRAKFARRFCRYGVGDAANRSPFLYIISFTVSLYILYCHARVYNRDAGVIGCGGALQGVHKKRRKRRLRKNSGRRNKKAKKGQRTSAPPVKRLSSVSRPSRFCFARSAACGRHSVRLLPPQRPPASLRLPA